MSHPVLLVHDGVRRQNLQRLDPAGVHRLVFGGRDRKELRERYPEGDRNVGLLAEDVPLLDGEDREFALQCCGFQYASHRRIKKIKGEAERMYGQAVGVHPCDGRSVGACACGPPP